MAQLTSTPRPRQPGDLLRHPLAILAVVVLVINDHVLKTLAPGLLSGKLSDFAGLMFFPLLVVSAAEFAALGFRRRAPDRQRLVLGSVVATALGFGLVKTTALGTVVFAWSLGIAGWVVSAGPIRGGGPLPAEVMTDPGDLVALVALLGAWWIVSRSAFGFSRVRWQSLEAHRGPSRPAVSMLVIASLATIASGGAVQQASSATYEEHIHLDANHTTAVRHLTFEVDNHDANVRAIVLSADTSLDKPPLTHVPQIVVTLIPDRPAGKIASDFGRGPRNVYGLDVTDLCLASCSHGATIIARLDNESPAAGVDLTVHAGLWAFGGSGNAKLDTELALRNDAERAFTGNPTSQVAKTQDRFRLSAAAPKHKMRLQVLVAADALKAPLDYPLVVTVTMYVFSNGLKFADVPSTIVAIGETEIPIGDARLGADLLSLCRAGTACEIPLVVNSEYTPTSNPPNYKPSTPPGGFADLTWHFQVRVERYDGRPLPDHAVSIRES